MKPLACCLLTLLLGVPGAGAHASDTLRVGSHVLTTGDSAGRVVELLGKPARKTRRHAPRPRAGRGGVRVILDADRSEQWEYRRGNHRTTVTLIDGRVADIDDRRH